MSILILGGSGMLGHQIIKGCINRNLDWHTIVRSDTKIIDYFGESIKDRISKISDIKNIIEISNIINTIKPNYIINCIGVVKQSFLAKNYIESISINSLLPHQLEEICFQNNSKLIHISTDCVFDGLKGNYNESDVSDATDLYGQSKYLGEIQNRSGLTVRTSIIGHEITEQTHGLVDWFLGQNDNVNGFTKAIFSGLTTLELSNVIIDIIIPQNLPGGLYQVASEPINKFELLNIINKVYCKNLTITPKSNLKLDRSLNASNFNTLTGYNCPQWFQLIQEMHEDHIFYK